MQTVTQSPPVPSGLSRTLDPRVPSNRNILILAVLAGILVALHRLAAGLPLVDVALQSTAAGIMTTLTWAIGRELDPDYNLSAYIAALLMVIALLAGLVSHILLTLLMVASLRVVNRTTGLPVRLTDALALSALSALIIWLDGFWMAGILLSAAFALDALLPRPNMPHSLIYSALALTTAVAVTALIDVPIWNRVISEPTGVATILVSLLYVMVVLRAAPQLTSTGDYDGQPLVYRRVLAGQLLALVAVMVFELRAGMTGVLVLLPVWAALVGVVIRRGVQLIRA